MHRYKHSIYYNIIKMKFNILKSIILPAAFATALISCKKDEETTVLPSLSGTLSFSTPEFIEAGTSLKMTPKGISHPDNEELGYYWKVTPVETTYDTTRFQNTGKDAYGKDSDGSRTFTFPDSLGTYTVNCYAYAPNYSSSSAYGYVTTIKREIDGSISGRQILPSDEHERINGTDYYYVTVNGLKWMRHNLDINGGVPFRKAKIMDQVFGRYYSYEEALNACPQGWRLPTDAEWISLCKELSSSSELKEHEDIPGVASKLMVSASFNSINMWTYWKEVGDPVNSIKMEMIPVGFANLGEKSDKADTEWLEMTYPKASFDGLYSYAAFWTADAADKDNAYYRYLHVQSPDFKTGKADKKYFGASIRCVKE